jgi:hypothetical protein
MCGFLDDDLAALNTSLDKDLLYHEGLLALHYRVLMYKVVSALASRCLVLMYKVGICHPSTKCYAISGTLSPISGGRPAMPVLSLAAISLVLTSLVTTPGPLAGPAQPTCNYPFPIPTAYEPSTKLH